MVWIDKYRIVSVLKERGNTRVCVAQHIRLKQLRVIKTVLGPSEENNAVLKEAYMMKQLKHPCIPEIYDIEEQEGGFSIIEEYIQGDSFYSYCLSKNPETENIIKFTIQLCSLLEYLHGQKPQILHLDLKPENLLVKNGNLYLIDFGSAIEAERAEGERSLTGTPGYAAPECYRGEASEQSDLYSVGMLMKFMLAHSRRPFKVRRGQKGAGYGAKGKRRKYSREKHRARHLMRIMKRATREKPSDRYPSAAAMKHALEAFGRREGFLDGSNGYGSYGCQGRVCTVALAGSGRRMGVTFFALQFASFLKKEKIQALYLECNESDAVLQMLSGQEDTKRQLVRNGIAHYHGIPMEEARSSFQAKGSGEGYELSAEEDYYQKQGYQVLLEDFGVLTPENREEFLKADLSLLFAGCKDWELENTWKALCVLQRKDRKEENYLMLLGFAAEKEAEAFSKKFPQIPCRRVPMSSGAGGKKRNLKAGEFEELLEELLEMLQEGNG